MTASDPEKQGNGLETSSNGETEVRQSSSEGYYDPDANLSEEEKRKAVRHHPDPGVSTLESFVLILLYRRKSF